MELVHLDHTNVHEQLPLVHQPGTNRLCTNSALINSWVCLFVCVLASFRLEYTRL